MSTPGPSIATLARKTAEARRVAMNTFARDLGVEIALDLMGLATPSPAQQVFAKVIADTHHDTLAHSTLFLADSEMVDLMDAAAPTMPDQELHETDIIAPHGFVYFAEPLPEHSGVPPEVPLRALSWAYLNADHALLSERGNGLPAVLITAWVPLREVMEAKGVLRPGTDIAPNAPGLLPNSTVMWSLGSLIGEVFGEVPDEGSFTPGFYQRALATFWTLAQQPKMTSTTDQGLQPTDQRRYRRAGIVDPTAPVRVVQLHTNSGAAQGPAAQENEGTGRKISVRFAVRGHWRRQWYRSIEAHRHIWIDPFIKGPENAPLTGGERVFLARGPRVDEGQPPKR